MLAGTRYRTGGKLAKLIGDLPHEVIVAEEGNFQV